MTATNCGHFFPPDVFRCSLPVSGTVILQKRDHISRDLTFEIVNDNILLYFHHRFLSTFQIMSLYSSVVCCVDQCYSNLVGI